MDLKDTSPARSYREIDRWDGGVGWIAHPEETMQRASHALATEEGVWLVDPVDAEGIDELLANLGTVAGVVVLLNRHTRDAGTIAERHDVSVHVPKSMGAIARKFDAPVSLLENELEETGFRLRMVVDKPGWREASLFHDGTGTLVVADALGTVGYMRVGRERLGVHPLLRLFPPRRTLGSIAPNRILVGHGEGVFDNANAALADALSGARRRYPALLAKNAREAIGV